MLTGNPGSYQGPVTYSWSVDNSCLQIVGSSTNSSVTIKAIGGSSCSGIVNLKITSGTRQPTCNVEIINKGHKLECDFDFWTVPRDPTECFHECTGGLDHNYHIHHVYDGNLPQGYYTSVQNVQLSNTATFSNCQNCASPILNLQGSYTGPFPVTACSPYNHSMFIDIAIHDANGDIVELCEDVYFSFFVPEC